MKNISYTVCLNGDEVRHFDIDNLKYISRFDNLSDAVDFANSIVYNEYDEVISICQWDDDLDDIIHEYDCNGTLQY